MALAFLLAVCSTMYYLIGVQCLCEGPQNATFLPTQTASFSCPCSTEWIYINDDMLHGDSEDYGPYIVTVNCDGGNDPCIRVVFKDAVASNSTWIRCNGHGRDITVSYLVVGPPLSPSPSIAAINSSALLIQWDEPFTWKEIADIRHYTVRMFNRSSGCWNVWTVPAQTGDRQYCASVGGKDAVEACSQEKNGEGANGTAAIHFILTTDSVPAACNELTFYVSAWNVVGESERSAVRAFFNDQFHESLKWEVMSLIGHDDETSFLVKIQPPRVCASRVANFTIDVKSPLNQSYEWFQTSALLDPSNEPLIYYIPPTVVQNDTARLVVTAETADNQVHISLLFVTTNASEKSRNYSSGYGNDWRRGHLCLVQSATLTTASMIVLCAVIVCLAMLGFWFFEGSSSSEAIHKEAFNDVYGGAVNNIYDYI